MKIEYNRNDESSAVLLALLEEIFSYLNYLPLDNLNEDIVQFAITHGQLEAPSRGEVE